MSDRRAYINALAGVVPEHDVHHLFVGWAQGQVEDERMRKLFLRMADRSGIEHRWSVLPPPGGEMHSRPGGFYHGPPPTTARRMACYAEEAPKLALGAIAALREKVGLGDITHLVVASCTGFIAPGIDQIIARELGIPHVERTLVGFMGCYAAVSALRTAYHIVRSDPNARVLTVTVELCSLHLQETQQLESLLAQLQFSDGAAAALVTAEPGGFEMSHPFSCPLENSHELIQWKIGDTGFEMTLSGEVPGRLRETLARPDVQRELFGDAGPPPLLAVHAGGRSVLDAVEHALAVAPGALADSRSVLARYGNMSSATILFVLADMMARGASGEGIAIAFGPGLAAEAIRFRA